jgi:hypothetical protein
MKKDEIKNEEVANTTSEFSLDDILNNIDDINDAGKDKEITITHKRLKADFTFLVPELKDLVSIGGKDSEMNIDEVYKALSMNLITRITDEMLKALKVATQLDAVKKLFTKDEALLLMATLMEGLEDTAIAIKKK